MSGQRRHMIIVGSVNKIIYAIERESGNVVWMFETGGEVWSSASYNGKEIFIGSDDGFVYCLDIDGKLLWKTKLNGKIRSFTIKCGWLAGRKILKLVKGYNLYSPIELNFMKLNLASEK
jgi:outer membrane protein assembly factor BamB